ncbi:MAG: trigger factor [Lachnospiraceae bacterium]|nr:trigger factor [Lachnospiraceae bacterium]
MKKRLVNALLLAMSVALLGGCAKAQEGSESAQETTQETVQESVQESGQAAQAAGERTSLLADGQKAADFVTLGNYKGLKVTAEKEEIDEEEVEIQMRQLYFSRITVEDGVKDRPVQRLDMTNIDYEGKKDGVAFEGGTAKGSTLLIGSGQFIPGFEDGLIGVMPGETVELNLTFPENYKSAELAGQDAVFTVKVNFIPEMEDERVSELGLDGVTDIAGLRDYVRNGLTEMAEDEYLSAVQDEVWSQLMENTVFSEFPEDIMERSRNEYAGMLDQMAASWGIDAQTYAQVYGTTYDELLDQYAEVYAQQMLVVQAIADAEGLNISDEKLPERINEYAAESGVSLDVLTANGLSDEDFRQSFLYEDVMNFLVDNSVREQQ